MDEHLREGRARTSPKPDYSTGRPLTHRTVRSVRSVSRRPSRDSVARGSLRTSSLDTRFCACEPTGVPLIPTVGPDPKNPEDETSLSTSRPAASLPPLKAVRPGQPCCSAATWMHSRCPKTQGSTSRPGSTAQCMRAATTRTPPCLSERRSSCRTAATNSLGVCCSCSRQAKRATTAHNSCSMKASSRLVPSPTVLRRPSNRRSLCTCQRPCHLAGSAREAAPLWRLPTRCKSSSPASAATQASRTARSTPSQSRARSSPHCRP